MTKKNRSNFDLGDSENDIAAKLLQRAADDIVLKISFVGESPHLLFNYFREMITEELQAQDLDPNEDPLLGLFAEAHAAELRDFVVTGVSIDHMIHVSELEQLETLSLTLLQTDIWDSLKKHIAMAEEQFKKQSKDLPKIIRGLDSQGGLGRRTGSEN